ncbi:hypothetical protein OKW41_004745 [Paraburkholderia sp. UCT70]
MKHRGARRTGVCAHKHPKIKAAMELAVGSDSNNSYFVTLTPLNAGSVIKVMHPANAPDDPPEEEMRFDIARCAT